MDIRTLIIPAILQNKTYPALLDNTFRTPLRTFPFLRTTVNSTAYFGLIRRQRAKNAKDRPQNDKNVSTRVGEYLTLKN